jgi:hypothetical protein
LRGSPNSIDVLILAVIKILYARLARLDALGVFHHIMIRGKIMPLHELKGLAARPVIDYHLMTLKMRCRRAGQTALLNIFNEFESSNCNQE